MRIYFLLNLTGVFFFQQSRLAAMTELEKCMESLILIFHRYAKEDGDGKTLSKKELKKLVENELPTFIKVRIFLLSHLFSILNRLLTKHKQLHVLFELCTFSLTVNLSILS